MLLLSIGASTYKVLRHEHVTAELQAGKEEKDIMKQFLFN